MINIQEKMTLMINIQDKNHIYDQQIYRFILKKL